ncbi:MAG TPA: GatB/YqeY domain-containing protein [Gemmatimonadaceae bacterium]|nr:GatB/YqeY domain-containing protein [Gemmatimonadaceae bacterium]
MSELFARLQGDLNSARKSQDKSGVLLLGTVLSEVKNKKIELKRDPTDADVIDVLRKSIKRRRESVEMYTKGNRQDLADKESSEAAALEKYLPAQVSDEELRAAVRAAIAGGATQIGAVMGKVLPQFKGRAEGGTINAIAREELSKQG